MRHISLRFYELQEYINQGYKIKGLMDVKNFTMLNNDIKIDRQKIKLTDETRYTEKIYNNMTLEELFKNHYIHVYEIIK